MAESKSPAQGILDQLKSMKSANVILAVGVIFSILLLIIPISTVLLDVLIAINIMVTLIVLLTVTNITKAVDFSVFPTLILLTTVFRIVLNVSSTRLILGEGKNFDGKIIKAFGDFVVGGNFIVGLVIFLILVALQFIVITKGATRISEVAARFSLDGMPTKLMTVDTELAQGRLNSEEAALKRKEIRMEADFYGSMDGASKFVSGDVKLGFLITVINIVGGIFIGMSQGMSAGESASLFLKFTVGDGLVSQIPSILISLATGIIVARSESDKALGEDIQQQLGYDPKVFYIAAGFLFILALIPGLPTITLLILSIGSGFLGYYITKTRERKEKEKLKMQELEQQEATKGPEEVIDFAVHTEQIELEIGFNLIPLVDKNSEHVDLLERIKVIRRTLAGGLGLVVPPIRIRDNINLRPNDYIIKIKGVEEGKGTVKHLKLLAIPKKGMEDTIEGEPTIDPTHKEPAKWIDKSKLEEAESMGYSVVDASTVISYHITDILRRNAEALLGRKEVEDILNTVAKKNQIIVNEINGLQQSIGVNGLSILQKVLKNLLREQISIRNMVTILEAIIDNITSPDVYMDGVVNETLLTEYVRQRMKKQICKTYTSEENELYLLLIDPPVQEFLESTLENKGTHLSTNIDPKFVPEIASKIFEMAEPVIEQQHIPVIVSVMTVRSLVHSIIEDFRNKYKDFDKPKYDIPVISYSELISSINTVNAGVVEIPEMQVEKEEVVDEYGY